LNANPTGTIYPKEDGEGNPLTTEFGYCSYRAHQEVSIQEMPERAPPGQLPTPIDVYLEGDLSDSAKPGDRVKIVGVYRSFGKNAVSGSSTFKYFCPIVIKLRAFVLANCVSKLGVDSTSVISENDIMDIKNLAKRDDIFELLSSSIAPSIYGHKFIKQAVLLQLLGGMERNLENGTHIRGYAFTRYLFTLLGI